MNPDSDSLIALGMIFAAFALATAFAYWRGRRDEAWRVAKFRAEWDRRAWLSGRRSVRYDMDTVQNKRNYDARNLFWGN